MKITEPMYYREFHCVADACPYHCCQQWRIGVEEKVVECWKDVVLPDDELHKHTVLADYLKEDDGYAICHRENGVCPFIDEAGLCRVIKAYSDEMTPTACQQFPREIHQFDDAQERSLSLGCPVALDLLLKQDAFSLVTYEEDTEQRACDSETHRGMLEELRDWFLDIIQNSGRSVSVSFRVIVYLSLQIYDMENELDCDFDVEMLRGLQERTNLEKIFVQMEHLEAERSPMDSYCERNELFLDIVGNYYQQGMYVEFLEPVMKAAQQWENNNLSAEMKEYFEQTNQQYEKWYQLILCQELSGAVVANEQQTMYDVLVKLQWLAMEYATLKHWLCLLMLSDNTANDAGLLLGDETEKKCLAPDMVKEAIMILSRIMGYTEEDIFEYMEDAFEDAIWPFGYLNLIV